VVHWTKNYDQEVAYTSGFQPVVRVPLGVGYAKLLPRGTPKKYCNKISFAKTDSTNTFRLLATLLLSYSVSFTN